MEKLEWYIAGPLLGISIPIILLVLEKQLGVSSSLRVLGSYLVPRVEYFAYDRKSDLWQLYFVVGLVFASLLTRFFNFDIEINHNPMYDIGNGALFISGGVLIGFGARYAGGCTAGHCLMGNSIFSKASLLTTLSFFVGGLLTSHIIIPLIFKI